MTGKTLAVAAVWLVVLYAPANAELLRRKDPLAGLRLTLQGHQAACRVAEPLLITVTVRNETAKEVVYRRMPPISVTVAREGRTPLALSTESDREQKMSLMIPPVPVAPGAACQWSFWVVAGRTGSTGAWRFLWDQPGRYVLTFPNTGDPPPEVTLNVLATPDAMTIPSAWTPATALWFVGKVDDPEPGPEWRNLLALATDMPATYLAPYAAMTVAHGLPDLLKEDRGGRARQQRRYAEIVVAHHPRGPLREQALSLIAETYAAEAGTQEHMVARTYDILAREFPDGELTKALQRRHNITAATPRDPQAARPGTPAAEPPPPPTLALRHLNLVPTGPREMLQSYLETVEGPDWRSAARFLRADYQQGDGGRKEFLAYHRPQKRSNPFDTEIVYTMVRTKMLTEYKHPVRGGSWRGRLCCVTYERRSERLDVVTSQRFTKVIDHQDLVLLEDAGEWLIVAWHDDSRWMNAACLYGPIHTAIVRSLPTARVFRGDREVLLADELRALLAVPADAALAFRATRQQGRGSMQDTLLLIGKVTVTTPGPEGKALPTEHEIEAVFILSEDRRRLSLDSLRELK